MNDVITSEELCFLLLLVDIEIPEEVIETWTNECRREVFQWAASCYLEASDNVVEIPSKPLVLSNY